MRETQRLEEQNSLLKATLTPVRSKFPLPFAQKRLWFS
jgi:hypothetical protein